MPLNKNLVRGGSVALSFLVLVFLLGHEVFGRFESKLDLTFRGKIECSGSRSLSVVIQQRSTSAVDTSRRDFADLKSGVTNVSIWIEGSLDTLRTSVIGRYFSDFRTIQISDDSSNQVLLIPNSTQGLPTGWVKILYLRNDSTLMLMDFANYFIGDVDKDGSEEVNIPSLGGWMRLDVTTGNWVAAKLREASVSP